MPCFGYDREMDKWFFKESTREPVELAPQPKFGTAFDADQMILKYGPQSSWQKAQSDYLARTRSNETPQAEAPQETSTPQNSVTPMVSENNLCINSYLQNWLPIKPFAIAGTSGTANSTSGSIRARTGSSQTRCGNTRTTHGGHDGQGKLSLES